MGAGWMYYHKSPPRRKCPTCGKTVSLVRLSLASNGEEVWGLPTSHIHGKSQVTILADGHGGIDPMFDV